MKHSVYLYITLLFLTISQVSSPAQKKDGGKIVDAVQAYTDGDYEGTVKLLDAILAKDPRNDAALYYKGLSRVYLGQREGGIKDIKEAVSIDPSNYWYRDRLAMTYQMTGQTELAISEYEKLLEDFPKKVELYYSLVNLYYANGLIDKTLKAMDEIEKVAGKSDATVMTRYRILLGEQKQEEAMQSLKDYVAEYPSPSVLTVLGDQEMGLYNDSTAIDYYDRALKLESGYIPAKLGKTEAYRLTRKYPEFFSSIGVIMADETVPAQGKADYIMQLMQHTDPRFFQTYRSEMDSVCTLMVGSAPRDSMILQTVGVYYYRTGRNDKAKESFKTLKDSYPGNVSAMTQYLQILTMTDDYEGVARESEAAMASDPHNLSYIELANYGYFNMGDYEMTIENCRRAVAANPADSAICLSAYTTMGDCYHELGKQDKVYEVYKKALKINPDYGPVLNNYAYYLSEDGKRLGKAAKMASKAVASDPDNATYLDTMGWILHLQGKDSEAKSFFKHAMLYGGKDSSVILMHYALVLEKLGETDLSEVYKKQAEEKAAAEKAAGNQ